MTALHYAAVNGLTDICKLIISKCGPSILSLTNHNYLQTPLHYAAVHCNKETYFYLLSQYDESVIKMCNDQKFTAF